MDLTDHELTWWLSHPRHWPMFFRRSPRISRYPFWKVEQFIRSFRIRNFICTLTFDSFTESNFYLVYWFWSSHSWSIFSFCLSSLKPEWEGILDNRQQYFYFYPLSSKLNIFAAWASLYKSSFVTRNTQFKLNDAGSCFIISGVTRLEWKSFGQDKAHVMMEFHCNFCELIRTQSFVTVASCLSKEEIMLVLFDWVTLIEWKRV